MLKRVMLACLRFYKNAISPLLPPACRFEPTCSEYAATAIETHGPLRGSWLSIRRLLRCHPFGGSGWDPVPERHGKASTNDDGVDR